MLLELLDRELLDSVRLDTLELLELLLDCELLLSDDMLLLLADDAEDVLLLDPLL
jgi:hypothetical protein